MLDFAYADYTISFFCILFVLIGCCFYSWLLTAFVFSCVLHLAYCILLFVSCFLDLAYCILLYMSCLLCLTCCILLVASCILHLICGILPIVVYCLLNVADCCCYFWYCFGLCQVGWGGAPETKHLVGPQEGVPMLPYWG